MAQECAHLDQIRITDTDKHVCEDCVKTGSNWVHAGPAWRTASPPFSESLVFSELIHGSSA